MRSYDYAHRTGVEEVNWEQFARWAAELAAQLAARRVDMILGIARAGLFPATAVACALRCDLSPIRLTRRQQDRVVTGHPVWKVDAPAEVADRIVAVVDEIADTGETLALAAQRVTVLGARRVITASLCAHSWARPQPDVVAHITDALVIFPWDRQVFQDGSWQMHPELIEALRQQGMAQPLRPSG